MDISILIDTVNAWWNTWHRFTEENDNPPSHIQKILIELESKQMFFDLDSGCWY